MPGVLPVLGLMTTVALPTVSIVIPTLNSAPNLAACLRAIRSQDYPMHLIEILVMDGGSTDATASVAQKYGVFFIRRADRPYWVLNAEARMGLGVTMAKGDIVAFIMSDNFLPTADWLRTMVRPFQENPAIVLTQTLHYAYDRSLALLDRYAALMGVSDPVAYYLDKRDRMSQTEDTWRVAGEVCDRGWYLEVRLRPDGLPPMGCNGALFRRDILKYAQCGPELFRHSDVVADLVRQGYDSVGIVRNDIIHANGDTFVRAMKKRLAYFRSLRPTNEAPRRYLLFDAHNGRDVRRLLLFVFYSLTLIKPTWDACAGYLKIRDSAWFMNPVLCMSMTIAYGLISMFEIARRTLGRLRVTMSESVAL